MSLDFKSAFEAVSTALGVISSAKNIPGIDLIPYVGTVATAAQLLQAGINLGLDVTPNIIKLKDSFANGLPPKEDLDALDADNARLGALIDAPLPPPEEGEED